MRARGRPGAPNDARTTSCGPDYGLNNNCPAHNDGARTAARCAASHLDQIIGAPSVRGDSGVAQEAGDRGSERIGLIDVAPVAGGLEADPAQGVAIEEGAAVGADAAGDAGDE
jgi:hypothetical protein